MAESGEVWNTVRLVVAARLAVVLRLVSTFANTTAQVGRYVDSGLGKCCKSLANVQSPFWAMLAMGHTHQ